MLPIDDIFTQLLRSPFRQRFRLGRAEYDYCQNKGEQAIRIHAAEFIRLRLSSAIPANDGKQTPMRGHPVFIAQHATATCCRGCLSKWHGIGQNQPLTSAQQSHAVEVIIRWITQQMQHPAPPQKKTADTKAKPDAGGQLDLL